MPFAVVGVAAGAFFSSGDVRNWAGSHRGSECLDAFCGPFSKSHCCGAVAEALDTVGIFLAFPQNVRGYVAE